MKKLGLQLLTSISPLTRFTNWSSIRWTDVKYKLAFGFSLVILLSAISTYLSMTFLSDMNHRVEQLVQQSAVKVKLAEALKSDLLAVGHAEKKHILLKTQALKEEQNVIIDEAQAAIEQQIADIRALSQEGGDLLSALDEFEEVWHTYLGMHEQVIGHSQKNSNERAKQLAEEASAPAFDALLAKVEEFSQTALANEEKYLKAAERAQRSADLSSDLSDMMSRITWEEAKWVMHMTSAEGQEMQQTLATYETKLSELLQELKANTGGLMSMTVGNIISRWNKYRKAVTKGKTQDQRQVTLKRHAKDLLRIEKQVVQLRKVNRTTKSAAERKADDAVKYARQLAKLKTALVAMQLNERSILASNNVTAMNQIKAHSEQLNADIEELLTALSPSLPFGEGEQLVADYENYLQRHYQVAKINQENGNVKAFQLSTMAAAPMANRAEQLLNDIVGFAEQEMKANQQTSADAFQQALVMTLVLALVSAVVGASVAIWIGRNISKGLARLVNIAKRVQIYGDYSLRTGINSRDEIGSVARALDALLAQLQTALGETNRVLASVADGEFHDRVSFDLDGDLDTLKSGVNASAQSVDNTMAALEEVMQALGQYNFKARLDDRVKGDLKGQVDSSMTAMEIAVADIQKVMQAVAQGEFNLRVDVALEGDMQVLKEAINSSLDELQKAMLETSQVVEQQALGNLTAQMQGQYGGTLDALKQSLNHSSGNLNNILSGVNQVASDVSNMASQVAQASHELSERTQSQASSLEETAASMEELSATVMENAEHASQASDMAEQVLQLSQSSAEVSTKATQSMHDISSSSQQMADIIELIDGIAFQTNLLALNASVEAARAGEQGRGFAVVASEVRELAQKTAAASKDIKELIEINLSRIEEGALYVNESGQAMGNINHAISQVAEFVMRIAAASAEQRSSIQQVSTAVTNMDGVTQQNSAVVDQTSNAATSLNKQAQNMMQQMRGLKLG